MSDKHSLPEGWGKQSKGAGSPWQKDQQPQTKRPSTFPRPDQKAASPFTPPNDQTSKQPDSHVTAPDSDKNSSRSSDWEAKWARKLGQYDATEHPAPEPIQPSEPVPAPEPEKKPSQSSDWETKWAKKLGQETASDDFKPKPVREPERKPESESQSSPTPKWKSEPKQTQEPPRRPSEPSSYSYHEKAGEFDYVPPEKSIPVPVIIVGILVAVILVVGVILFLVSQKSKPKDPASASSNDANSSSAAQADPAAPVNEIISSGYIDAGSNEYATIYESADTGSSTLARAYTGDAVDIYAIENNWYRVKFGTVTGYLPAEFVTFSEPVKETAAPATEKQAETPTQAPTQAPQTQPVQKPTCSANITVDTSGSGDGGTFYLNVSGSYAYYTYTARAYLYDGTDYEDLGQFKSSDSRVSLTAGSIISYVTATVTPYSIDGTAGESVTCRGDLVYPDPPAQSVTVTPCNYEGWINTHGYKICSFTTDYVVNHGKEAYVRESLGNGWHVKLVNSCTSYGVFWYEAYDADDGDYYGWIDATYID